MKCYSVRIIHKRIRQLPKITVGIWIMLAFMFLYCITQLYLSTYQTLDDLQDCEIYIDRVNLRDSHDTKGSRMKLEIVSEKTTYYVWYPQSKYIDYAHDVENVNTPSAAEQADRMRCARKPARMCTAAAFVVHMK